MEILTASQMYAVDKETVAKIMPEFELMSNAGFATVCEISKRFKKTPAFILCGSGNNGGDGFVIANLLQQRGWSVEVVFTGNLPDLKGAALKHASRWKGVTSLMNPNLIKRLLQKKAVLIDAMFGIGLNRPMPENLQSFVKKVNETDIPCIAVDLPSGVAADTGEVLGEALKCCLTVTFCRPKPAHFLYPAKEYVGETVVCPIGIPDEIVKNQNPRFFINDETLFNIPPLTAQTHKYTRGAVLICGGSEMTGAARLAARAARRAGAGWVAVSADKNACPAYAADCAENIVFPITAPEDFKDVVQNPKIRAIAIGSGCGISQTTKERLKIVSDSQKPFVADADAIAFAKDADMKNAVLTPHGGEFYALFPELKGLDKLSAALSAAKTLNCTVVLKGADTVIACADGRAAVNAKTSFELSTAGSGDVLTGITAAMLSKGLPPFEAACAAVFLHSQAAVKAGKNIIASDIVDCL